MKGMAPRRAFRRDTRSPQEFKPYVLVSSGPDTGPRVERFARADSYKAGLVSLQRSGAAGLEIDEVVDWLDRLKSD